MRYNLRVQYKSGAVIARVNMTDVELMKDLAARMFDVEGNDNVESWTITPQAMTS